MGKKTWTAEETQILYDNFPEGGIYKCIELLPGKTRSQIKAKIDALHIKSNHYDHWTDEENTKLKEAWETYSMKELLNAFPGRTYQKIELHAHYLGYHAKVDRSRKCDLSFLDLDSLTKESLYWWGFIMADGHLSKTNTLIISLKNIDKAHLEKIAKRLSVTVKEDKGFVRIQGNDKPRIESWKRTLCMEETAKTYFPPDLSIFEKDFVYFFIGFVDGDGCIWLSRNYPQLRIELHFSWKKNLDFFAEVLRRDYGIESVKTEISKKGTAILRIGNRDDIILLSNFANEVECLDRKWEKISHYTKTQKRKRSKTYEEYIKSLQDIGIFSIKDAYQHNAHPDRGAKRFNVSINKIDTDLKNKNL